MMTTLRIAATSDSPKRTDSLRSRLSEAGMEFLEFGPGEVTDEQRLTGLGLDGGGAESRLHRLRRAATLFVIAPEIGHICHLMKSVDRFDIELVAIQVSPPTDAMRAAPPFGDPVVAGAGAFLERLAPAFDAHYRCYGGDSPFSRADYSRAYRYGAVLASAAGFRRGRWDDLAPPAQKGWNSLTEGPWEHFSTAVRFAWRLALSLRQFIDH